MLPNEVFALACRAWYEEQGLIVDKRNGEFAHSPLTRKECDTGYYLLHGHHQHHGLIQSKDLDKCCFFSGDTLRWLRKCDYFPENFFELWDIYDKYIRVNGKRSFESQRKNKTGLFDPEVRKNAVETHRKNETGLFDPEIQKKGLESQRKNKTGLFDPEIQKKGLESQRKNKTGIYDPDNRKKGLETNKRNGTGAFDPKVRKKATDNSIEINRNNKTGIFDPEVRKTGIERGLESQRKNGTGLSDPEVRKKAIEAASEARKKAILVTFLDGSKQHFKSIKEAADFLGVTPGAVRQRLEKGLSSKRSRLAIYEFELV